MNQLNVLRLPIDVSKMVCEHDTRQSILTGDRNLESITFRLAGCGTQNAQSRFTIVALWADDQCRPPIRLLETGGWLERDPNEVTSIRNIRFGFLGQSTTSRPTSAPKSVSPCNCEGLQFSRSSFKLNFFGKLGRITNSPSRTSKSTSVPSETSNCPASVSGIRMAKLLPHF